jgi:ADP-ribose pyrophosphatase YjhB (NUDIX family)
VSPAPEIRAALRRFRRRRVRRWGAERAAMAVTVVTARNGPAVLMTRRADALSACAGQLTVPGQWAGRWESASAVARRQLADHFGIHLAPESVLGLLDDYLDTGRQVITPVVLWAGDHTQAAGVIAVRFTELDVEPMFVSSTESDRSMIRLPLHGEWLHAPAAAVLHQFREVVLHRRHTRVAHLGPPSRRDSVVGCGWRPGM